MEGNDPIQTNTAGDGTAGDGTAGDSTAGDSTTGGTTALPALLSVHQTRMADRLTIESGISGIELLANAGTAVFNELNPLLNGDDRILLACGTGNNGGDGLVLAKLLLNEGYNVTVMLCGSKESLKAEARQALDALDTEPVTSSEADVLQFDLLIDAVLGAGLNRPVAGELAELFEKINQSAARVVSIDIPSGVNGDTGEIYGSAIKAERTITFFVKKPGHLLYPGRALCGATSVVQIGINSSLLDRIRPTIFENMPALWRARMPLPNWQSHKYTRGHSIVLSGGMESSAAACLAARAALRSGSGLVTVATPIDAVAVVAAHLCAEMLRIVDSPAVFKQMLKDDRISAVLLGPGLGVSHITRELVLLALEQSTAVILDADALTSFEADPDMLFNAIAASAAQVVMTPHHGEFTRLFGNLQPAVEQPDSNAKTSIAREAAKQSHSVVVYKGPDTTIAAPSADVVINSNAPPWLATAGSGDVLAGTVCGLMAQGVDAFDAACAAVWMHGKAAQQYGPGLIATDIADQYPGVIQTWHRQTGYNSGL